MSDSEATLEALKERVLAFAEERDWLQFHSPKNLSMAIAAESAELMEHFLWTDSQASHELSTGAKRGKIEEELADIVIYAIEFANVTGIDLQTAILAKIEQNAIKYPVEKSKGRSEKYTEL